MISEVLSSPLTSYLPPLNYKNLQLISKSFLRLWVPFYRKDRAEIVFCDLDSRTNAMHRGVGVFRMSCWWSIQLYMLDWIFPVSPMNILLYRYQGPNCSWVSYFSWVNWSLWGYSSLFNLLSHHLAHWADSDFSADLQSEKFVPKE